eukprot:CAMPEP_0170216010 /NCGR_PEP_ID=MMETSP0116_2-20130129/7656_1 /TAXON_ID=400756 /ORGANISM="Durinskia baltica, Strain CSIRO CS-38" /LENGTH=74 /DNA_ID=CAMNT_0010466615 /DNA_START=244 /DNA_END=465 /DNA_ORIENTATION=+
MSGSGGIAVGIAAGASWKSSGMLSASWCSRGSALATSRRRDFSAASYMLPDVVEASLAKPRLAWRSDDDASPAA